MIELKVNWMGQQFFLAWDDGHLSGDMAAVKQLMSVVDYSQVSVPGLPMWEGKAILKHAGATYLFAKQLFDEVELVAGDLPDLGEVPEGAVT